jgi:hypothetical protein
VLDVAAWEDVPKQHHVCQYHQGRRAKHACRNIQTGAAPVGGQQPEAAEGSPHPSINFRKQLRRLLIDVDFNRS